MMNNIWKILNYIIIGAILCMSAYYVIVSNPGEREELITGNVAQNAVKYPKLVAWILGKKEQPNPMTQAVTGATPYSPNAVPIAGNNPGLPQNSFQNLQEWWSGNQGFGMQQNANPFPDPVPPGYTPQNMNVKSAPAAPAVSGVMEKVLQEGHWIGLEVGPLNPAIAVANGIPADVKGVLVDEVTLLAAASGILAGDVISAIDDRQTPDLGAFKEATRPLAMSKQATVTVYRNGSYRKIRVSGNEELGLAQMEAAPMINATDTSPHGYYGPCDRCHAISKTVKNTGQLAKDSGDVLATKAPPIRWGSKPLHGNRGTCTNCHKII